MASTYEVIETETLGTATASVTFSTISGSYTDLVLVINGGMATTTNYATSIRFNSDTGSNYSLTRLYGNGTSASSDRGSSQTYIYTLSPGRDTLNATQIIQVMNYSNTTTYKTCLTRSNDAGYNTGAIVGLWRSTAAITSISVSPEFTANWKSGSTFTLYGIASA
jgi:hypothetical protein